MWVSSVFALCAVASASPAVTVTGRSPRNAKVRYPVRVCTSNLQDVNNCQTLDSAFKTHPSLEVFCINRGSFDECFDLFNDNAVDVVSLNPRLVVQATLKFVQNAFKEVSETEPKNIPVLVVKKSSTLQRVTDTWTSKICISQEKNFPRWLRTLFLCGHKTTFQWNGRDIFNQSTSTGNSTRSFIDAQLTDNPIGCLESGTADAAFLGYDSTKKKIGDVEDYELLCTPLGRRHLSEYTVCNMYNLNTTSKDLGPEEMKIALHNDILQLTWKIYMLDYVHLAKNYEGDFKVFYSKAESGVEFLRDLLTDTHQLEEFMKTHPYLLPTYKR